MTLAGTYGDDVAPDVEMRLSFPKKSPTPSATSANFNKMYKFPTHHQYFNESQTHRDNGTYDTYGNGINGNYAAVLPPPTNNNNKPKRSLSRNVIDGKAEIVPRPHILYSLKPQILISFQKIILIV